eukprot:3050136-Rhodomonas_salina.1
MAEATRWNNFKTERNEARKRAEWLRLEREAKTRRQETREQEFQNSEARLVEPVPGPAADVQR